MSQYSIHYTVNDEEYDISCDNDLQYVEDFDKITELTCDFYYYFTTNEVTISLPQNLIEFSCSMNNLTELPALPTTLKILKCSCNELKLLKNLPKLEKLCCDHNRIRKLDLPNTLIELWCDENVILNNIPVCLQKINGRKV
jgi:Leucine-rich repeat (LRR) protein